MDSYQILSQEDGHLLGSDKLPGHGTEETTPRSFSNNGHPCRNSALVRLVWEFVILPCGNEANRRRTHSPPVIVGDRLAPISPVDLWVRSRISSEIYPNSIERCLGGFAGHVFFSAQRSMQGCGYRSAVSMKYLYYLR